MSSSVRVEVAEVYEGLRLFQLKQCLGEKLKQAERIDRDNFVETSRKAEAVGDKANLSPLSLR